MDGRKAYPSKPEVRSVSAALMDFRMGLQFLKSVLGQVVRVLAGSTTFPILSRIRMQHRICSSTSPDQ